jgi:hypothetical protein
MSLMRLAEDRAARGDSHHEMLAAAAMRLDELETTTHSAGGILKVLMDRWDHLVKDGAAVIIVLDEQWKVKRAHIRMADGRKLASQLLDDSSGSFDLNLLKLTRHITWQAADLAQCQAVMDGEGRIRQFDRNEKGGPFFDQFQRRLRTEGLPLTHVLSGD